MASVRTGPRRQLEWARGETNITALGVSAEAAVDLLSTYESNVSRDIGEVTVTRTLGSVTAQLVSESGGLHILGFGITRVTRVAFAAGVTALPMPLVERHADWLYYRVWAVPNGFVESSAGVFRPQMVQHLISSKGQRKMQENEEVLVACLRADSGNTSVINFVLESNILLKMR